MKLAKRRLVLRAVGIAGVVLVLGIVAGCDARQISLANSDDPQQVAQGKRVYQRFCSECHGADLQGQEDWRKRKDNGRLPAPPHDETGHTWHHPDQMLFGIIKNGLVSPNAPEGYVSDMPAWGGTLADDDIWAVLAYIQSRWPPQLRKQQAERSQEFQARH